jgi:hypothetical protein
LHCCQQRHPGPEHGNGPARPSCGPLSQVPRGEGQDDQRWLPYANRKVLISPVGEDLLHPAGFGGLVFSGCALETVVPRCLRFKSSSAWPGSSTNSAWRRSEPGVRRDAWWYPLMELIADGGPMDGQLRTDLWGYALAVQLSDTLKVAGRP